VHNEKVQAAVGFGWLAKPKRSEAKQATQNPLTALHHVCASNGKSTKFYFKEQNVFEFI